MNIGVKVNINSKTMGGLKKIPDIALYKMARQTLDLSETTIPKGKTGNLRKTSMSGAVRVTQSGCYIGSYTDYASKVWKMPDDTNWTTPGTNNAWYKRTLKTHGQTIVDRALSTAWREVM